MASDYSSGSLAPFRGRTARLLQPALRGAKVVTAAFARVGISFATTVSYLYNPGANQDEITNMVAKLKSKGCTTVVPIGEPGGPAQIRAPGRPAVDVEEERP